MTTRPTAVPSATPVDEPHDGSDDAHDQVDLGDRADRAQRLEALLEAVARADSADERARRVEAVVREAMPLADSLALRYAGRGVETDDLLQVARAALVAAVRRYRPGAGRGFAAYAVPSIRGELKRHFRDAGWVVRPPRGLQELRAELVAGEEALRHRTGREVTSRELAEALGRSVEDVGLARATASAFSPDSLDAPLPGGGSTGERLADGRDEAAEVVLRTSLHDEVERLSPRERVILRLRFVEERTQSEIGAAIGVSQMQVSRLLGQVLARLRDRLEPDTAA